MSKINSDEYSAIFWRAKQTAVYGHAMLLINSVINEKKLSDKEMFNEIKTIIYEAIDHLDEDDE